MFDFKSDSRIYHNNINWIYEEGSIRNIGFYIGKVVDNKDEYNQGNIRVYIPELMDEDTKDGILVRPIYQDKYQHIVPKVGDLVLVTFIENNFQEPVYLGTVKLLGKQNESLCAVNTKIVDENDYWLFNSHDSKFRIRYDETNKKSEYGFVDDKIYFFLDNNSKEIKIVVDDNTFIDIKKSSEIIIKKNNSSITLTDQNIEVEVNSVKITVSNSSVNIVNGSSNISMTPSNISIKSPIINLN